MTNLLFDAVAFATRAHRHQIRKDGVTPYVSHVFRVAMVVATVFRISDEKVLAAAVLHDTIEDTTTDYDDLSEHFGTDVADWVSALTKEMHLPEAEREDRYHARLAAAPWQVAVCKLADIYDNLNDSRHLPGKNRQRTLSRSDGYLSIFRGKATKEVADALALTEAKLAEIRLITMS